MNEKEIQLLPTKEIFLYKKRKKNTRAIAIKKIFEYARVINVKYVE